MNTQPEALRLADALDCHEHIGMSKAAAELRRQQAEIERLNEALAEQPAQQEPVGKKTRIGLVTSAGWDSLPVGTEFYTSPPAQPAQPSKPWVGLTDEEAAATAYKGFDEYWTEDCNGSETEAWAAAGHAIEAKLREKNHG